MSSVKLKKDKQKKVKGLSKAIYIIAKIGKVLTLIGAISILMCMAFAPMIVNNIKIKEDTVEVFGEKFDREENKLVSQNHKEMVIEDKDLDFLINHLEDSNLLNIPFIELSLLTVLIVIVLEYYALRYLDKLFSNIYKEDTPFTLDNVSYIKKIAYFMIAILVLPRILGLLTQIIIDEEISINFDIVNVLYILVIFTISYIFEYGYEIQRNSKAKMYGEIDE